MISIQRFPRSKKEEVLTRESAPPRESFPLGNQCKGLRTCSVVNSPVNNRQASNAANESESSARTRILTTARRSPPSLVLNALHVAHFPPSGSGCLDTTCVSQMHINAQVRDYSFAELQQCQRKLACRVSKVRNRASTCERKDDDRPSETRMQSGLWACAHKHTNRPSMFNEYSVVLSLFPLSVSIGMSETSGLGLTSGSANLRFMTNTAHAIGQRMRSRTMVEDGCFGGDTYHSRRVAASSMSKCR